MEYIREAAQLGGASTFVENFPDKYGTYLERPVRDYYSGLPEGTTRYVVRSILFLSYQSRDLSMFGRVVDYGAVKYAMDSRSGSPSRGISGGQAQRVAL